MATVFDQVDEITAVAVMPTPAQWVVIECCMDIDASTRRLTLHPWHVRKLHERLGAIIAEWDGHEEEN